jgi:oligopeptide/dipeptide ABC transporter ATP-binding protein
MADQPLLSVEDLHVSFATEEGVVQAVGGVSFTVEHGEVLAIVGESGSGKSVSVMSLMGLTRGHNARFQGKAMFDGIDLIGASDAELRKVRGKDIAMVFQDPMSSLDPVYRVGDQIAEQIRVHDKDVSKAQALDRAVELMERVGIPRAQERLRSYPHEFSGGMRQRVMIAMALSNSPKLLIADEPTTALDVTIQAQILDLLDRIKGELGMGIILITHDMGVIAGRADRVAVMYAGRKVETAETVELFTHVRHPYTEALLASIPQLDQDSSQELYSIPGIPPDLRRPPVACRFAPRCAFATEQCRREDPPLAGEDPKHPYACFHPRNSSAAAMGDLGASLLAQAEQNKTLMASFARELELLETAPEIPESPAAATNSAGPQYILEFRDVSKEFPVTAGAVLRRRIGAVHAVTEVNLAVKPGETLGLVGESGCGKTTLGRMGVGLEVPTGGQVLFDGTDLGALRPARFRELRRDLQFMFQDPYSSLDPRMRVREIISEPLDVAKRGTAKERDEAVHRLLHDVGLAYDAINRYPHEFSGGQRQRLGLARALALNPKVIVADEPVSALDVSIRSQILNLMQRLQASYGLTYIVISHDLSVVKYLADRIGVMYLGRLVEVGPSREIYDRPAHPYTAGLLEAIPIPNPELARGKQRKVAVRGELPSPVHPPSGCRFRTRCPRAQEKCAEVVPPLRPFGEAHLAACHFPMQAPLAEAPQPARSGPAPAA